MIEGHQSVLCSACGSWSTRADRCSHCGAPPPAAAPPDGSSPGRVAAAGPAAADPFRPPAEVGPPHAAPPAGFGFPAPPPYGMTGGFPVPAPYGFPGPPYGWTPTPFRSLRGLAMALYALLGVSMVLAAASAAALFHRVQVLDDLIDNGPWFIDDDLSDSADAADAFAGASLVFLALAMIATWVLFTIWTYRARMNVDLFGPSRQRLSPGWAIGGWLAPLANLIVPKLMLHDIWRASDPRTAERGGATPGRVPLMWSWWPLWVVSLVAFPVSMLIAPGEVEFKDAERVQTADTITACACLALIVAGALAIPVVRRITGFQHEREMFALASGGQGPNAALPGPWAPGTPPVGPWAPATGGFPGYAGPPVPLAPGAAPVAPSPFSAPAVPPAPAAPAAAPAAPAAPAVGGPAAGPPPRPAEAPTAGRAAVPAAEAAAEPSVSLAKDAGRRAQDAPQAPANAGQASVDQANADQAVAESRDARPAASEEPVAPTGTSEPSEPSGSSSSEAHAAEQVSPVASAEAGEPEAPAAPAAPSTSGAAVAGTEGPAVARVKLTKPNTQAEPGEPAGSVTEGTAVTMVAPVTSAEPPAPAEPVASVERSGDVEEPMTLVVPVEAAEPASAPEAPEVRDAVSAAQDGPAKRGPSGGVPAQAAADGGTEPVRAASGNDDGEAGPAAPSAGTTR